MIDPANVPQVAADEWLARYVVQRNRVRADNTVKPDAFVPHPYRDLSVTRHRDTTDKELWKVGEEVSRQQQKTLYGRADVIASIFIARRLRVIPDAIPSNPNHANVLDWPVEKSEQKSIAQEIVAQAMYLPVPAA